MKTPNLIISSLINRKLTAVNPKTIAAATLLCGACLPASATENVTRLEAVTSYGQQDSLQQRQQAPNNTVVIDQTQFDNFDDQTAGDVLRRLPGVIFGGAAGESKDVRIRGLDKEYSQILINGRRIPGGGEKREFQLDQLPASLIERIEVIRAPTADMDAQGIAGTINIILKTIPENTLSTFSVGVSQLQDGDTKPNVSLSYGGRKDDFGYLLNLNAQQRQQLKNKTKQSFKADGSADKSEQETEDKQFDELQFAPRFDWALSENDQLSIEPLLLRSDEEKTKEKLKFKADGKADGKELEDEDKQRSNWALYGQWQHNYTSGGDLTLGVNLQESKEEKEKSKQFFKGDGALDKVENETEDKSDKEWTLSLKNKTFIGEQHTLIAGIEFANKDREKDKLKTETKKGTTKDKTAGKDRYEITEQRFNAYILDEYSLGERHLLTPGIRFEWTETEVSNDTDISSTNNDAFWSPSLHYLFTWSDKTNVRASITSTVRRPKFDDLAPFVESKDGTLSKPDKAGTPGLLPEKSTGFDLGIEHYFANSAGNIGLNIFYRDIDDKIENRTSIDPLTTRYQEAPENVGSATLKGIELDTRWNMVTVGLDDLTLTANVTFLDGEVTDRETGLKTPLKEQPDYVYNLGFDHQLSKLGVNWGINLNNTSALESDEIKDGNRSVKEVKAQQYLDLYIKKSFGDGYVLSFSAQNLLEAEKDALSTGYKGDGSIAKIEHELEQSNRVYYLSFSGRW